MEISPIKILYMALISIAFGAAVGGLNDLNRFVRMLFGKVYGKRRFVSLYNLPLPISGRAVGEPVVRGKCRSLYGVAVFFQDIALFSFSGVGVALLNYYFNNGRPRLYTPVAVVVGFLLYYFTVGKAVLYCSDILIFALRFVIFTIFEIFYYPARKIVVFFGFFVEKLYININKSIAKKQKMVYNNNKEKSVMRRAFEGFVDVAEK